MADDFLSLAEASRVYGKSFRLLKSLAARGQLPLFTDPSDRRKQLVRKSDLDRLTTPIPLSPRARDREAVLA
jgi:hypothetical protein